MDRNRLPQRPPLGQLLDAVVAAAFCVVGLVEVLGRPLAEDVVEGPVALNVVTVLLGTLPLAVRRRAPLGVSLVLYGVLAGRALAADPLELYATYLALLVATYTVASYAPLRDALLSAAVSVLALAVAVVQGSGTDAAPDPVASLVLFGTVWLVGRVVGVRNERAAALLHARDEHAAEAVAAERARIAREMHDVVSHSLAAIVMQSSGARNVLDRDPDRVRDSLGAIERSARQGLEEMRRLLGLLGEEDEGSLQPQPGLARLDDLVADVRATGPDVTLQVHGEVSDLPPAVDVSAYRVLQEALTNVMKHAHAAHVRVDVRRLGDCLELEVVDDGTAEPDELGALAGSGRGLVGMRERVRVLGGSVETGSREPGPGFRVAARIPV
jgi:signal transduction histidine kinase